LTHKPNCHMKSLAAELKVCQIKAFQTWNSCLHLRLEETPSWAEDEEQLAKAFQIQIAVFTFYRH